MVGVNYYMHRIGTVALLATLFAAIHVNGRKEVIYSFGSDADFDLQCNDVKNSWKEQDNEILSLLPEHPGCLETNDEVFMNALSSVNIRFYREATSEKNDSFSLRLRTQQGDCPEEQCVWNIASDPQHKFGSWVVAEHKFPIKDVKKFYIQLQVNKSKGKFLLDYITVLKPLDQKFGMRIVPVQDAAETTADAGGDAGGGGGGGGGSGTTDGSPTATTKKSKAPSMAEMSKSLMITSASVLTINHLLN